MKKRTSHPNKGFTFIEILLVIGIIGLLLLASYPSIQNTLETRNLENATKYILTTMQRAKLEAVRTKVSHRVRFSNSSGDWEFLIEARDQVDPTQWNPLPGAIRKTIPSRFVVSVSLPTLANPADPGVIFTSLGTVPAIVAPQNFIELQSLKLKGNNQDDLRRLEVYMGGAIRYVRSRST
jgi:prepilin-type N-terminal cleavage/methylation domain-containing protein